MYDFYSSRFGDKVLKKNRKELRRLYEQIPSTTGCMENINKDGGCSGWCCEEQNPQLMYSEFLNTWNYVVQNWSTEKISALVMRAVKSYLNGEKVKGCVFFDKETRLCSQHETRPFNCRTYGQIPEEEFKPRYERLKILYPDAPFKDQCSLVKTDGNRPTEDDMDAWFHHLRLIEKELLGTFSLVHDGDGGSYRTYHDHILLRIGNMSFLMTLTKLRLSGTPEKKEQFLNKLEEKLKTNLAEAKDIKYE